MHICIYIYIYRERERDRDTHIHVYIYIYIYIYISQGSRGFEEQKAYITQALGGHDVSLQMIKAGPERKATYI